jgi:hypothetical protein
MEEKVDSERRVVTEKNNQEGRTKEKNLEEEG